MKTLFIACTVALATLGAGVVQYIGNPRIEQEISGVGKITRREGP